MVSMVDGGGQLLLGDCLGLGAGFCRFELACLDVGTSGVCWLVLGGNLVLTSVSAGVGAGGVL